MNGNLGDCCRNRLLANIVIAGLAATTGGAVAAQVAGEIPEMDATAATAPLTINALAPDFIALPFAEEFVTTGAEGGNPGDHYFPSNGDGTFGPKSNIPGLGVVDGTDVADMDNDGHNDFVVCDGTGGGRVYLYTNDGAGLFFRTLVASGITNTSFCTNLRIADFNNDGLNDFVVGDNRNALGTKVYLQGPIGVFTVSATLDTSWTNFGNNLFGVAVGDVDLDGAADILMLGYGGLGAGEVQLYLGDGLGGFGAPSLLFDVGTDFGVGGTVGLVMFDLEGDGDLDVVVGGGTGGGPAGSGTHFLYENDGTSFVKPTTFVFDVNAQTGIDAFDADKDGDDDLVVAGFGTRRLYYVQNLDGTLAAPVVVDALTGPSIGVGAPSQALVEVALDVRPKGCPNPLNIRSQGALPVAILGTADFDVSTVDVATIELVGIPPLRSSLEDVATPFEPFIGKVDAFDCTEAGPDGFTDLVLHFDAQAVIAAIGAVDDGDLVVLELTGRLQPPVGTNPIIGEDVVWIIKKGPPGTP
jgi:hypothetical protein